MMNHARYRATIITDPHNSDPELRAHRESCQECNLYTERLLRFESRLERALRLDIPIRANVLQFAQEKPRRAVVPRRWMALAASVLLGIAVAGVAWIALPGRTLAADVVAHMAGEPQAWRSTDAPVPESELNAVLRASKLRLSSAAEVVSYANSCTFRGHVVPHLVLQTATGPVTVMVLVHESVSHPTQFDEQGYRGTIVPVPGHGSIAVLMRGPGANLEQIDRVAAQVLGSIVWTG
jgi:Protein of unknown function (DUF3379)